MGNCNCQANTKNNHKYIIKMHSKHIMDYDDYFFYNIIACYNMLCKNKCITMNQIKIKSFLYYMFKNNIIKINISKIINDINYKDMKILETGSNTFNVIIFFKKNIYKCININKNNEYFEKVYGYKLYETLCKKKQNIKNKIYNTINKIIKSINYNIFLKVYINNIKKNKNIAVENMSFVENMIYDKYIYKLLIKNKTLHVPIKIFNISLMECNNKNEFVSLSDKIYSKIYDIIYENSNKKIANKIKSKLINVNINNNGNICYNDEINIIKKIFCINEYSDIEYNIISYFNINDDGLAFCKLVSDSESDIDTFTLNIMVIQIIYSLHILNNNIVHNDIHLNNILIENTKMIKYIYILDDDNVIKFYSNKCAYIIDYDRSYNVNIYSRDIDNNNGGNNNDKNECNIIFNSMLDYYNNYYIDNNIIYIKYIFHLYFNVTLLTYTEKCIHIPNHLKKNLLSNEFLKKYDIIQIILDIIRKILFDEQCVHVLINNIKKYIKKKKKKK